MSRRAWVLGRLAAGRTCLGLGRTLALSQDRFLPLLCQIPSPNTETQDETALGEVALDRPHTTTDFEPQTPKPEQLLRRRLLGVLIWGLVVLTVGVLTA